MLLAFAFLANAFNAEPEKFTLSPQSIRFRLLFKRRGLFEGALSMEKLEENIPKKLQKMLSPGEAVLIVNRPPTQPIIWLWSIPFWCLITFYNVATWKVKHPSLLPFYKDPSIIVIFFFFILNWSIAIVKVTQVVTDRRILIDDQNTGFYSGGREIESVPFEKIENVAVYSGFFDSLLKTKSVRCSLPAKRPLQRFYIVLRGVDDPEKIVDLIRRGRVRN